jgi:hypothetical protein
MSFPSIGRWVESVAVAAYAVVATPVVYIALCVPKTLVFTDWWGRRSGGFDLVRAIWRNFVYEIFHDELFFPFPSAWLWAAVGVICGLTWLTGAFWCRRCGRRRHGDPAYYDRSENAIRRCRLLGGIAGIPAWLAVFAYYTVVPVIPSSAWLYVYWVGRALRAIGPAIDRMIAHPMYLFDYTVKGSVFLAFLAAPFAISAAIGAACGWFYGRHVRPPIRRLWPAFPGAAGRA